MNTVNLNSTDNVSLASLSGGATTGSKFASDGSPTYAGYGGAGSAGQSRGGGQGTGNMVMATGQKEHGGGDMMTDGQQHTPRPAGLGHHHSNGYADVHASSGHKVNLPVPVSMLSDPASGAASSSKAPPTPGQQQQQASAGQNDTHHANTAPTQDHRGILPKSPSRPHSLSASSSLKFDTPSMPLPSPSLSLSTSTSAAVSRHNSSASTVNSSIAHSALHGSSPAAAINGTSTTNGAALTNGASQASAHHRLSLGNPIQSNTSSAASSPNISSSPYFAGTGGAAVNRTASGTVNSKGQSSGFRTPPSPRAKRKPVPPLHLPTAPRELPPSHPFAQSSPRELTHKMSGGQMRNVPTGRNGSGSSSGDKSQGQASPLLAPPGSAKSWKAAATSSAPNSEPGTPGFMEDKDLFYKPPQASPTALPATAIALGPVPPRRSPSSAKQGHNRQFSSSSNSSPSGVQQAAVVPAEEGVGSAAANRKDDEEVLEDASAAGRRGTFHNGLNIHIPAPPADSIAGEGNRGAGGIVSNGDIEVAPGTVDSAKRRSMGLSGPSTPRTVHLNDSSADTPSPTHTSSPFPAGSEYLNRSLPSLPANASKVSLGMFSILETGPNSGINGSPPVGDISRWDRNHSVDSTMTGLTSIETPKDLGRSTTTLDMFSALAHGPERKDSFTPTLGSVANGVNTAQLQVHSPSLQSLQTDSKTNGSARKKSGRLGFLSYASGSGSRRNRSISSSQPGVIPEDEEPVGSGDALSRQATHRAEAHPESDDEGFSVSRPPSKRKMFEAGQTYVRDEKGDMIKFADFFPVVNGDAEAPVKSITKAELKAEAERALRKGHASMASLPSILHEGRGSRPPTGSSTPTQDQGDGVQSHAQANAPELRSFSSNLATPPSSARPSTMSNGRDSGTYPRNVSATSGTSTISPSPFAFNISMSNGSSSPIATSHTPSMRTQDVGLRTDRPQPKTVVFFIRTFYCGQCQDYTLASIAHIDPDALKRHNIRLVIISNGNWRHIKPYRELFKCPFPIYVDASRKLYRHMGMTKSTINPGPFFSGRAAYNQNSVPRQWMQSMTTAVKLPKRNPGNLFQLGGEFIIAPGYECAFAHRMTNFSNHMEAADLFRIAGVDAPLLEDAQSVQLDEAQQAEAARLQQEMEDWRAKREATLENMARKKAQRIGQPYVPPSQASRIMLGLDDPSELDMRALQDSDDEDDMERIHGDGGEEDGVLPVHPDDIAAVAAGHAANAGHAQNGDGDVAALAPPMMPSATASSQVSDQPEQGSTEYHTPADTVEDAGPAHVDRAGKTDVSQLSVAPQDQASRGHDKLDVAVLPVSEHGSAPNSAQPSVHQHKLVEEQEVSAGTAGRRKQEDDAKPATEARDTVSQPVTQPMQAEPDASKETGVADEDEGLSLAEKYERLMRKYEALKVEHDRRSSVAV